MSVNLNIEEILNQAKGHPALTQMLGQAQAMMAAASVAQGGTAKYKVCPDPQSACDEMTRLFKAGHLPTGAPSFDGGRWVVFYWEREA